MPENGNFKIVLSEITGNREIILQELAQLLMIDTTYASQIISTTPIILLDGLLQDQAGKVMDQFAELLHLGAKIEMVDVLKKSLPRLSWPEPPAILTRGKGSAKSSQAIIACPHCGKPITISVVSRPAAESKGKDTTDLETKSIKPIAPDPRIAQALKKSVKEKTSPPPVATATPKSKNKKNDEPSHFYDTPIDLDTFEKEVAALNEEDKFSGMPDVPDILDLAEVQKVTNKATPIPSEEGATPPLGEDPISDDATGNFNIFMSRPSSKPKRESAAEILAEIKGISLEEAQKLAEKMIIPVAKGISQTRANRYKQKLKTAGIPSRVTKK